MGTILAISIGECIGNLKNIKNFNKIKPAVIKQIPLSIRLESEKLQDRIMLDSPPGWADL